MGELIDKIAILELKAARISGESQLQNVDADLQALRRNLEELRLEQEGLQNLVDGVRRVNADLWDVEDAIRDCERRQRFDEHFISLARAVYLMNDERAELKRRINELCDSALTEEKLYTRYT